MEELTNDGIVRRLVVALGGDCGRRAARVVALGCRIRRSACATRCGTRQIVRGHAKNYDLDPALLAAVIYTESRFNARARVVGGRDRA